MEFKGITLPKSNLLRKKKRQSMLVEFMLFFTKPELVHVSCYFEAVIFDDFDDFCRHERLMQEGPR